MPGSVSLVLFPAQQVRDTVPGELHDRWRPRPTAEQLIVEHSHRLRIRNHVLPIKGPDRGPQGPKGLGHQRLTRASRPDAWRPAHPGANDTRPCRVAPEAARPQATQDLPLPCGGSGTKIPCRRSGGLTMPPST